MGISYVCCSEPHELANISMNGGLSGIYSLGPSCRYHGQKNICGLGVKKHRNGLGEPSDVGNLTAVASA